jgi:Protein of unknown function DUF262
MDVHKSSLLAVFDAKQRLEVPLFQRQYVWNEEQQWLPLWEDIERKFVEALEGRKDGPNHFLGAMVLDQKQTPTGHVVVRQVIDGQQRLTTLQIFLSAYRDFCENQGCSALAAECEKFLLNTGMMADVNVDRFKVWPTQLDRPQFTDFVSAGSREEVLKRHPLRRKPYARKPDPRPRMVEAYLFFFDQLKNFFLGEDDVNGRRSSPSSSRRSKAYRMASVALCRRWRASNTATPSAPQNNHLAVQSERLGSQLGGRSGNRRIAIGPVIAAARKEVHLISIAADDQPIPVMLDLVTQPGPAGGRAASVGTQGFTKPEGRRRRAIMPVGIPSRCRRSEPQFVAERHYPGQPSGYAARPPWSSFSPLATIMRASSARGRCSLSASLVGVVIQVSISSCVVSMTGIAFG